MLNNKWYGRPDPLWKNALFLEAAVIILILIVILLSGWRYLVVTRLNGELSIAIEEWKKSEEQIRMLNEELEHRVLARTTELQSALHHHESFTYSISHDLRAPLRAIDGYSAMLSGNFSAMLPPEGKAYLQKMSANARKMGHLIDALLSFSRFNLQKLAPEEVDLSKLVKHVLTSFATEQAERHITIDIGPLPPCTADPILIREVIYNLVSNAVKFTRKQHVPHIEIGSFCKDSTNIYFVKDNGVGFDMEYYDKLFGVCQRLHGMEEFEGTGVGLAISKNIIERHGGKIWAQGEPGKGATFYFKL